jgi:hypothetical protein
MLRGTILVCMSAALYAQGAAASQLLGPWPAAELEPAPALMLADSGSRDRIVAALERRYNAKVVRIIDVSVGGRLAYDIRLLSNDRVWTVRVDAATGQELPRDN